MLEVSEQARLPLRRMLEICLDTVSHRLLRSTVTVAITLLAIAFLAFIMAEGYLGNSTRRTVSQRLREMNAYSSFLRAVGQPESDERMVRAIAAFEEGGADFENLAGWGGFAPAEAARFVAESRRVVEYLSFFEDMPVGRRVLLVEQAAGLAIFDRLSEPANMAEFRRRLAAMRTLRLPGRRGQFEAFMAGWPEYRRALDRVQAGRSEMIRRLSAFFGESGAERMLREARSAGTEQALFARLADLGFKVEHDAAGAIIEGSVRHGRILDAIERLRARSVRTAWLRTFHERFSPGEALRSCARAPARADWVRERLAEAGLAEGFDRAEFLRAAADYAQWQDLAERERMLSDRYGTASGLSPKTLWLIAVSFMVCVVGIANAMLMSVLERFKEIATMKCLGARNGTIAFLFITESTIVGLAGGLLGMFAGLALVLAVFWTRYRGMVFERFPAGDILWTMLFCLGCSLALAMVAAIYPARVASRMAPMDAMRVD